MSGNGTKRCRYFGNFKMMNTLLEFEYPPVDVLGALYRYIWLSPCPSEVFNFIPSLVTWQDIFIPGGLTELKIPRYNYKWDLSWYIAPPPMFIENIRRNTLWGNNLDRLKLGLTPEIGINKDNCRLIALIIPVGGGKTTLSRQHPDLFVDHDDLVDKQRLNDLLDEVIEDDYSKVNSYLRQVVCANETRILLTWGSDTCPSRYEYKTALIVRTATGSKDKSDSNIKSIRKEIAAGLPVLDVLTYDQAYPAIVEWVGWPTVFNVMQRREGMPAQLLPDNVEAERNKQKQLSLQNKVRSPVIQSLYPRNRGRPGGKINLEWFEVALNLPIVDNRSVHSFEILELLINNGANNDWESTFAAGLLLLPFTSKAAAAFSQLLINNERFFSIEYTVCVKLLKLMHTHFRMECQLPGYSVGSNEFARQLYGVDTLPGRSENMPLDIAKEISMRVVEPTASLWFPLSAPEIRGISDKKQKDWADQWESAFNAALSTTVHSAIKPSSVWPISMREWYSKRLAWAASGGAPGAKVHWVGEQGSEGPTMRLNKRGLLLNYSLNNLLTSLEKPEEAALYSKAAIKFENGKLRAIWNTSIEHYLAQAYILDLFEPAQAQGSWNTSANGAWARTVSDLQRLDSLKSNTGVMFDYSDFNINHRHWCINALISKTVEVIIENTVTGTGDRRRQMIQDLKKAANWVNASREYTVMEDQETGLIAKAVRSLLSGERATSFTNGMLNRTYSLMVASYSYEKLGYQILKQPSFHQGDDVFAIAANVVHGCLLCVLYNLLGFAGQLYKITVDYRGRGEYLRLGYDADRQIVQGYPIRSTMGLIAGEFFTEGKLDPGDRAAAFYTQVDKLQRRGAVIPAKILEYLVRKNTAVRYTTSNKLHVVTIPRSLITTPAIFGGYGIQQVPLGYLKGQNPSINQDTLKLFGEDALRWYQRESYIGYLQYRKYVTKRGGIASRPKIKFPPMPGIFKSAQTFSDTKVANLLGVDISRELERDALTSSMQSSLPKTSHSDILAAHAIELDEYLKDLKEELVTVSFRVDGLVSRDTGVFRDVFLSILEMSNKKMDVTKHCYGAIINLFLLCNVSSVAAGQAMIAAIQDKNRLSYRTSKAEAFLILWRYVNGDRHHASVAFIETSVKSITPAQKPMLDRYLMGEFNFFPSPISSAAQNISTIIRDTALYICETWYKNVILSNESPNLTLIALVSCLECIGRETWESEIYKSKFRTLRYTE